MKRLPIVILLIIVLSGVSSAKWTNSETGIMELFDGDVRLNEIYSAAGVIVGSKCTLTVEGDVDAGKMFICRGGTIHITGKLVAERIYFDCAEGELNIEIGEIIAKYFTHCGGSVTVENNIVARSDGDDDGLGIVNINSEFAVFNKTRLTVGGGVFARGGDVRTDSLPFGDEASMASFFYERGIAVTGYGFPVSGGSSYINIKKGFNATGGGKIYCG